MTQTRPFAASELSSQPGLPSIAIKRSFRNLVEMLLHSTENFPRDRFASHVRSGQNRDLSSKAFRNAVSCMSQFLRSEGLAPGDRVGLYMENCPEWHISDFGILAARMIVVPIYPNIAPNQLLYILEESQCKAIILGETEQWNTLKQYADCLPQLTTVVASPLFKAQDPQVTPWCDILKDNSEKPPADLLRRAEALIEPDTVATIVYTSGTTGTPKGVILTHANLVADLEQCLRRLNFQQPEQAASFLPLSHVFERLLSYGYFSQGVPIAYCSPPDLPALLRQYRPAVMGCVPRALEKIHMAVMEEIRDKPLLARYLAQILIRVGESHLGEGIVGHRPSRALALPHKLADQLLFSRIRQQLGGRIHFLICGGAPLSLHLEKFFFAAGVPIVQGYGLTEASPVVSLNAIDKVKMATVGQPLDQTEVRIAGDGEVLVRGSQVMQGYYKDPEATREVVHDGWLYTGDLGYLDPDGYLVITGRKKEVMITAGGKNVSPMRVESHLRESPFIEEAVLVGDGRQFLGVLLIPNIPYLQRHLSERGIGIGDDQVYESRIVNEIYEKELTRTQKDLSQYERAKRFYLIPKEELHIPDLMTPTLKVRRQAVEAHFRDRISEFYS